MSEFSKTINQIADLVLSRIRSATGTSAPLYNQVIADINFSLQELATLHKWKWLRKEVSLSVPASTRFVNPTTVPAYPTDLLDIRDVVVVNGSSTYPLYLLDDTQARELYPNKTSSGSPIHYLIGTSFVANTASPYTRTIELLPMPDVAITLEINYSATFKDFTSAATEVPPIPQNYVAAFVELVAARVMRYTKHPRAEIDDARNTALSLLASLAKKDADSNKKEFSIRLPTAHLSYRRGRYK